MPDEEVPDEPTDDKGRRTVRPARAADTARRRANEKADEERGGGVENQEV